jgi:pilus assembly protein CpaB
MPFDFKRSLPFTLAIASGLVTSGMLYNVLGNQPKAEASMMVPMVVLAGPVDDTRALEAKDLSVVQVTSRPAGAFATPEEAVGRMPLVSIPGGQPLLTSHLAQKGSAPGLWHQVPKGQRAVTVAVNEVVGVGGFVKPGLNVDIISVYQDGGNNNWTSVTIVQDVPVLAIAQDDKKEKEDKTAKIATSATLLVSPVQAEAISLASEKGRIRLVLRSPGDHIIRTVAPPPKSVAAKPEPRPEPRREAPPPPQVTYFAPRQAAPPPAPAPRPKPPSAPAGIEIIRGANSEVVHP